MPTHHQSLLLYQIQLETGLTYTQALFYPELSSLASSSKRGKQALQQLLKQFNQRQPLLEYHRRQLASEPQLGNIHLELEPPPNTPGWENPVSLSFDTIQWQHMGEQASPWIAWVPALGIEVLAKSPEKLQEKLPGEIRETLLRTKSQQHLQSLVYLQRSHSPELVLSQLDNSLITPKQRGLAEETEQEAKEALVIKQQGRELFASAMSRAYQLEDKVQQLNDLLGGKQPRSILLIGPSGVGKTALQHEWVASRISPLKERPIWQTSGSQLIAGMSGFGMWQERCQVLVKQAKRDQAILLLGNLFELAEVGKGENQQQGMAGFLRPLIARGELLAISECTAEQLALLERQDPQLTEAFVVINLEPPTPEQAQQILFQAAKALGTQRELQIEPTALETLDRLHRRFASYSVNPGLPLRFLRRLTRDSVNGDTITASHVLQAFTQQTGLPEFLLKPELPFEPALAQEWFAQRVHGQPRAIQHIIDLLATLKAGLSTGRKPLASLLLIGPTGTGKTELCKALAEYLFGDRQRLLRLDMSEYQDSLSAQRLIGGIGFGSEGILTAKVREQPFAVILLDELEKAHTNCFDLLLQVLGEGRLTDGQGRLADFTNSVVIMTSNLGAQGFQQPEPGFTSGERKAEATQYFTKAVQRFLRPEMYNRIDAIIPFQPLDQHTLEGIAQRELQQALQRGGLVQRQIQLQIEPNVVPWLAEIGWDSRYGARPLKRAIERQVLLPLADSLNRYPSHQPLKATLNVENKRLQVEVQTTNALRPSAETLQVNAASRLRRQLQQLRSCAAIRQLENQVYRAERLEAQIQRERLKKRTPRLTDEQQIWLKQLSESRQLLNRLSTLEQTISTLETEWLSQLLLKADLPPAQPLNSLFQEWQSLVQTVYEHPFQPRHQLQLIFCGDHPEWLQKLVEGYLRVLQPLTERCILWQLPDGPQSHWKAIEKEPLNFLMAPRNVHFWGLELHGPGIFPSWHGEAGLHVLQPKGKGVGSDTHYCQMLVTDKAISAWEPPPGITRRQTLQQLPPRRRYDLEQGQSSDLLLRKDYQFAPGMVESALRMAQQDWLEQAHNQIWQNQ